MTLHKYNRGLQPATTAAHAANAGYTIFKPAAAKTYAVVATLRSTVVPVATL